MSDGRRDGVSERQGSERGGGRLGERGEREGGKEGERGEGEGERERERLGERESHVKYN